MLDIYKIWNDHYEVDMLYFLHLWKEASGIRTWYKSLSTQHETIPKTLKYEQEEGGIQNMSSQNLEQFVTTECQHFQKLTIDKHWEQLEIKYNDFKADMVWSTTTYQRNYVSSTEEPALENYYNNK